MRRPRAFTCSRLGAEPPPPPIRKPLGYSSLSSPCRCETCDKAPSPSPSTTTAASETAAAAKPPRKDVPLVSPGAEKPRFRRLPRGGAASSSSASTAAPQARGRSARTDVGEQRKPKRGSDRGDSPPGVGGGTGDSRASAVVAGTTIAGNSSLPFSSPFALPAFGAAATFASSAAGAGAATAAAAAAAAAVAADTNPAAAGIDADASAAEKSGSAAAATAAAASLLFEAGSLDKASASVTFIHFDEQGRPSLSDVNLVADGGGTSTVTGSSSGGAGDVGRMGVGLDRWKAPPTIPAASGVFSVGASSSPQAAAAAVGRRRRRVGG